MQLLLTITAVLGMHALRREPFLKQRARFRSVDQVGAAGAMDGDQISSKFLSFAKAARVLDKEESNIVSKLCEIGKSFLWSKARALVAGSGGRAILYSYGSDGTPLLTRETISAKTSSHQRVTRKAGDGTEFLVERAFFLTSSPSGEPVATCLFRDPRPLLEGKTAQHLFGAMCAFFPLLRTIGFEGVAVSHYVFDRAVYSPLARLARQRHALFYEVHYGEEERVGHPALLELKDWVLATGCCCHDIHNALKWGLLVVEKNLTEVHKKLYITIESLRNGFSLLHQHLPGFVSGAVQFTDSDGCSSDDEFNFWVALGVDPDIARQFSEMHLEWDGEHLLVDRSFEGVSGLHNNLCSCLLSVFAFSKFTDSRWCSVGPSCRSLLAGTSVGLQGLLQRIRTDPKSSDYYLHGVTN